MYRSSGLFYHIGDISLQTYLGAVRRASPWVVGRPNERVGPAVVGSPNERGIDVTLGQHGFTKWVLTRGKQEIGLWR
jgi:hypothetical protein